MSKPVELLKQKLDNIENKSQTSDTAGIGKTVHLSGNIIDVVANVESSRSNGTDLCFTQLSNHVYNIGGTVKFPISETDAVVQLIRLETTDLESDIEVGGAYFVAIGVAQETVSGSIYNVFITIGNIGEKHSITIKAITDTTLNGKTISINCTSYSPFSIHPKL